MRVPDKIRFYHQVLTQDENRLFVATDANLPTGLEVEVKIEFASTGEPITARAKIVAKRSRRDGGGEPGVWVEFKNPQIEAMRQALHIDDGEGAQLTGRRRPRFECSLPVLVDKPTRAPFRAVNISQCGVCLNDVLQVPVGQTVRLNIEFCEWLAGRRDSLSGKPVILVVDDDRAHLEILSVIFKESGWGVVTADSAYGVVNAVSVTRPSLVILDYMMPGIDGATLCKSIKQNPATNGVPVRLYSSVSEEHLAQLVAECGADDYVRKGAHLNAIVERIATFLQQGGTEVS